MTGNTVRTQSALIAFAVAAIIALPAPTHATNCDCYYSTDCADGEYCNWQSTCTRHCELQGDWDPAWGAPPQSGPQCDDWVGPCHDDQPQPPVGNDGDGHNCEPPTAANPGGGAAFGFKVRDGMCTKRKVKVVGHIQQLEDAAEVDAATRDILNLLQVGGGEVRLNASPYVRDVVYNLSILAVGLYNFRSNTNTNPFLADLRGEPCAEQAIATLGRALGDAIIARSHGNKPVEWSAVDMLAPMSPECATWMETRAHNCEFPHPHAHIFEYPNGLECIASNVQAMAASLYTARLRSKP